jgi:hypothetical protein
MIRIQVDAGHPAIAGTPQGGGKRLILPGIRIV